MREDARGPRHSVLLMLAATASFVGMQAVVKHARGAGFDTSEVMVYRTAPGLPLLWWSLKRSGHDLRPVEPGDVLIRSLLGAVAMGTNFTSMRWLSLAQFSTLNLAQPVFVALSSPFVLGEHPRRRAWLALCLALAGSLVLVVPGLESHDIGLFPAALGLSSALASAFAQMWVRKATASEPPERVVFHFAALVTVLGLVYGLSHGHFQSIPKGDSWPVFVGDILGMAVFGTLGQVLMTRAYNHGEASLVSMVAYSGILMSLGADIVLFELLPRPSALLGAALMIAAGFVLVRGD